MVLMQDHVSSVLVHNNPMDKNLSLPYDFLNDKFKLFLYTEGNCDKLIEVILAPCQREV